MLIFGYYAIQQNETKKNTLPKGIGNFWYDLIFLE
jgi:hypothetical protein